MDPEKDELDGLCDDFQEFGQIIDDSFGFTFSNSTVPLFSGNESYTYIACIEFDHKENLLWVANDQGHTTSFYRSSLAPYSKFWWSVDKNDLIPNDILTTHEFVVFVGKTQLLAFTRGGAPVFQHRDEHVKDICCGHWSHTTPRFLFYGGLQAQLYIFDLHERVDMEPISLSEESCILIRSNDRYLISANESGQITVRNKDFSKFAVVARVVAHNAGITDFDVFANYLICCGESVRQNGMKQGDNFMKVYDVRNLNAQAPIGFNQQPLHCRFIPGLDGCVCVSTGYSLFFVDILSNKVTMFASLSLLSEGLVTAASGQAIAVFYNSYSPFIQLFCNTIDPPFSLCDEESVFPLERELESFIPYDSDTSLAEFPIVYLPYGHYCSDRWSDTTAIQRYLCTKQITPDMMEQFKKGVEYFKSPFANTLVSGFNVWSYGKRTAIVAPNLKARSEIENVSTSEASSTTQPHDTPSSSVDKLVAQQTVKIDAQRTNVANGPNSIMERYQNAVEFVPGRMSHPDSKSTN
ncbi:PAN2-PAN3 deadenylation complex catalytic subunit PAN2 [Aphelenchoides besseyi]|nr:PAN2-PAN3 deadenylation complex catalytic subunit PAN2 [Aphelenchoides besseyi]KAI6201229.1 PAN2-PAN3 deadenylation complex catalytic subunit PAN2 [Aphelenchoides besseyi]